MAETERTGPLTGTQHWVWLLDTTAPTGRERLPLIRVRSGVPPGTTVDLLTRVLRRLMDRHEALRTSVRLGPGGSPEQVVHADVEPHVTLVEEGRVQKVLGEATAGGTTLRAVAHVSGHDVTDLEFSLPDISVDHYSISVLRADYERILKAEITGSDPGFGPVRWHPVDQGIAESENGPRHARGAALEAWRQSLERGPHSTLPFRWNRSLYWNRAPSDGEMIESTLLSRELADSCGALSDKLGVTVPTTLFGLLVAIMTGWTGNDSCAVGVVSSNRFEPHLMNSVGRYSDELRVVIDVADDPPFPEIARQAFGDLVFAYTKGLFDVGELVMEEARRSLDAGARFTNSVIYAYHDYRDGLRSLPEGYAEGGVTQRTIDYRTPNFRLDVTPVDGALELVLRASESMLSRAGARDFLALFPSLTDALLADTQLRVSQLAERVRLDAPWNGPGWARVRQSWIDLSHLNQVVSERTGVERARVFFRPTGGPSGPPDLVCYVKPGDPSLTPGALREALRDEVSHHPCLMVPGHFVFCDGAPEHPDDLDGWLRQRVLTRGSGDGDPTDDEPRHDREEAVASVFRALHPGLTPRMSATYAESRGEFTKIPAFLRHLAELGYSEINFKDFIGMSSLRYLAARLERKERQ
ncbi:condensation domain-containing protein [Streptomyces tailanensis]|uniref:condensation domain-containing protein n=1 Tax=Streptomyces tailanensis TaxID=2569858 RepID=UPI00122EA298|nr:condensation domain-containing protein [Streptomyces tailanensis]